MSDCNDIASVIKSHLGERGDCSAIYSDSLEISGLDFLALVNHFETVLIPQYAGKKVAFSLPTDSTALALFIALLALGCNAQVLDNTWPDAMMSKVLDFIDADVVITNQSIAGSLCCAPILQISEILGYQPIHEEAVVKVGDAHYTCFTSGSTGVPKACVRSELSWLASFEADQSHTKISANQSVFVIGSFAHSLFLYAAIRALFSGARVVIFDAFRPDRIFRRLKAIPNSIVFAVPTQLDALVRASTGPTGSVVAVLSTGSKLPTQLVRKLNHTFIDARVIEFYGTSELSYVAVRVADGEDGASLIGMPLAGVSITIQREDGSKCATQESGLVYVESPMIFAGYQTKDGIKSPSIPICVGDTGFLDISGRLHLVGRADRMFQSSGRNIIPEEIERILCQIEAVEKAAVFGLPDSKRENRIVAVLHLNDTVSRSSIIVYLKTKLAPYAVPSSFRVSQSWPVTISHKTNFTRLHDDLEADILENLS